VNAAAWRCLCAATALTALVMGTRTAVGLFVSPLNTATGVGLAGLGFAIAFGQLAQGFAQPPLGWLADRYGTRRVMIAGAWILAAGTLSLALSHSIGAFALAFAAVAIAGSAVGSNALLLAEVGRRVSVERRAMAFAIVSAGGSAGQMLIAPGTQAIIGGYGWLVALVATAALSLLALPLSRVFGPTADAVSVGRPRPRDSVDLRDVLRAPSFWLTAGSFGVCGFHVAYLTTHMPGVIERCGLDPSLAGVWLAVLGAANIAGSLLAGVCLRHVAARTFLIGTFAVRALSIVALLVLPATPVTLLGFAVLMGLSYMALLPAISQQVVERFGLERLATVFGIVALVHQIGSFAGAWLGGVVAQATGSDALLWAIDVGLAVIAIAFQACVGAAPTFRESSTTQVARAVVDMPRASVLRRPLQPTSSAA
jgi:predicted MFS family arabinose efflux permease